MSRLRRYLVTGLLLWVPLLVTLLVLKVLVDLMDRTLLLLPPDYRPEALLGFHVPGLGVVLAIIVLLVTGMLVTNYFGGKLLEGWERLMSRIPYVRSIYSGAKQVAERMFADGNRSFKKVVLVEFPGKDVWSLGFQTSEELGEVQARTPADLVCVFVPTTPNPTTGFLALVPRDNVIELDMPVDEALKMILSLGVVVPTWHRRKRPPELAPTPPSP